MVWEPSIEIVWLIKTSLTDINDWWVGIRARQAVSANRSWNALADLYGRRQSKCFGDNFKFNRCFQETIGKRLSRMAKNVGNYLRTLLSVFLIVYLLGQHMAA